MAEERCVCTHSEDDHPVEKFNDISDYKTECVHCGCMRYSPAPAVKKLAHVEPNERGLRAARAVSQWHIGFEDWADMLIDAYLNPDEALAALKKDKES